MMDWAVSKESFNVFDLLKSCADVLFALEQSSKSDKDRILSQAEIKKKIQNGRNLLNEVSLALGASLGATSLIFYCPHLRPLVSLYLQREN